MRADRAPARYRGIYIGLMSGTSLDGVDAVALQIDDQLTTVAHHSAAMPVELRQALLSLCQMNAGPEPAPPHEDPIEKLGQARRALSELYVGAVAGLPASVRDEARAIGAHGQTIRHRPSQGFSLQILDGALLAVQTGLPVVCDLRSADIAAGGQGAPLVPAFHAAAFGSLQQGKSALAVVNIGGIANASIIGPGANVVAGFDTGPGNRLLDDWCQQHQNQPFDRDGRWAASGEVSQPLLALLLADPYFARPEPKSTGRELFNLPWLNRAISRSQLALDPADVQATLAELSARTIMESMRQFAPQRVLICGGGAHNLDLMRRLNALCLPVVCESTQAAGLAPQHVEAAAFAWLAMQRVATRKTALAKYTGARFNTIAGALHLPAT